MVCRHFSNDCSVFSGNIDWEVPPLAGRRQHDIILFVLRFLVGDCMKSCHQFDLCVCLPGPPVWHIRWVERVFAEHDTKVHLSKCFQNLGFTC